MLLLIATALAAQRTLDARQIRHETTGFIMASRLNVRESPSAAAAVVATLDINQAVQIYETQEGFGRIASGWVDLRYVAAERLTLEVVRALAAEGPAEERRVWAERAVAMSGSDWDRRALIWTLEDIGDTRQAEQLRATGLPPELFPAPPASPDGRLRVEITTLGHEGIRVVDAVRAQYRIPIGRTVWVLPEHGPAVAGQILGAEVVAPHNCGGGLLLEAIVWAPVDGAPVAYWLGDSPPESFAKGAGMTHVAPEITARVEALARQRGIIDPMVSAASQGERWWYRATPRLEAIRDDSAQLPALDVSWDGQHLSPILSGEAWAFQGRIGTPILSIDLDGDGEQEVIFSEPCHRAVRNWRGEVLTRTVSQCCGC